MTGSHGIDIETLIPHRPPMRLVETIRFVDDEAIETESVVRETWPTADGGNARAVLLIEVVAQSAAALMGWRQRASPDPRPGLLVGIPKATILRPLVPVGTRLVCRVRLSRGLSGYCVFDGTVQDDAQQTWTEATIQAYRPD